MATQRNDLVKDLMDHALHRVRPGTLALKAAEATKPGVKSRHRKKLTGEEAESAARAVTKMIHRFELEPTKTLLKRGRATEPGATFPFFLTDDEMSGAKQVGDRRIAKSIGAHVESVRLICRAAEEKGLTVDEAALLDELAESMLVYLEAFRDEDVLDPDEELANDLRRIAQWMGHPNREVETVRFYEEAKRERLAYDPKTGTMEFEGDDPFGDETNMPVIPLFTRMVAFGKAAIFDCSADAKIPADGSQLVDKPPLKRVDTARFIMAYKIGFGIVPTADRGCLEAVFTLNPVTYLGTVDGRPAPWLITGDRLTEVPGHVVHGARQRLPGSEWGFVAGRPECYACDEFEAFEKECYEDEHSGYSGLRLGMRRQIKVTAAECARLLDDAQWEFMSLFVPSGLADDSVLPECLPLEGGRESKDLRDRLRTVLYADQEPTLAGLLLEEARKRVHALETYQMLTASGERVRKLAFRARMRT